MSLRRTILVSLLLCLAQRAVAMSADEKVALVSRVYGLTTKICDASMSNPPNEKKVNAGRVLFESTALSGNRDIACRNCHLDSFGTSDGLPIAVGVGGKGEGYARYRNGDGALVQRNAFSLRGRGDAIFTAFFWDGRVQAEENGRLVTQFGDAIAGKFNSPLAVAAILPLIERDEFIGKTSILFENDIQHAVGDHVYYERYTALSESLRSRFLRPDSHEDREVAHAFKEMGTKLEELDLADIGHALAAFIRQEFPCRTSNWDRYLQGDRRALSQRQKEGALLFFGKGRCASCHAGPFFSDFEYHSIGAPQGFFGPHTRHRDIGRAAVTHRVEGLFQFRTPPLTDVAETAPYGHNGAFPTLREIVVHHFNPLSFYLDNRDYWEADYYQVGKLISSRDPILTTIDLSTNDEVESILEFLEAL